MPFATWRSVIDALRAEALPPYMAEHATRLKRALDEHGSSEPEVALSLSDDVYLRSSNHARLELGIPLPQRALLDADRGLCPGLRLLRRRAVLPGVLTFRSLDVAGRGETCWPAGALPAPASA